MNYKIEETEMIYSIKYLQKIISDIIYSACTCDILTRTSSSKIDPTINQYVWKQEFSENF